MVAEASPGAVGAVDAAPVGATRAREGVVPDDVDAVVRRLTEASHAAGGRTVLAALDGAGGSGKTTIAARIAARLPGCSVVHADDFYRPMQEHARLQLDAEGGYQGYFDWQRLEAEVLSPLRAGRPATFQRYDWATAGLGEIASVQPGGTVLVEGVYSMRPEVEHYYDLTVYVETPRDVCLRRLHDRGQNPAEWIRRWRAAEDHYIERYRPEQRADLLVRGT